jgi:hypothetical protein
MEKPYKIRVVSVRKQEIEQIGRLGIEPKCTASDQLPSPLSYPQDQADALKKSKIYEPLNIVVIVI